MKSRICLLLLLFCSGVTAQIINIPHAGFKAALISANVTNAIAFDQQGNPMKVDTNGDGEVQVSEALQVGSLDLSRRPFFPDISSIEGILYFTNLKSLSCAAQPLSQLNLSGLTQLQKLDLKYVSFEAINFNISGCTGLQELYMPRIYDMSSYNFGALQNLRILEINETSFSSIDLSPCVNLKSFTSYYNTNLTSLSLSSCVHLEYLKVVQNTSLFSLNLNALVNLKTFEYNGDNLPTIDLSNQSNLTSLDIGGSIYSLDLTPCPNLTDISFYATRILNLDLSVCPNLKRVSFTNDWISSLNLTGCNQLENFSMNHCSLTAIDLSGHMLLKEVIFKENGLLQSINISGLNQLEHFESDDNHFLTSLQMGGLSNLRHFLLRFSLVSSDIDLSTCKLLNRVEISNNPVTFINLKCGLTSTPENFTFITQNTNLLYICADPGIQIYSYSNHPDCMIGSFCSFTPGGNYNTAQGHVIYDANNDGCNAQDAVIAPIKILYTDSTSNFNQRSIVSSTGEYKYYLTMPTSSSISPNLENAGFFQINPATTSVAFTGLNNLVNTNTCVSSVGLHSDVEVVILPMLRPVLGLDATYKIVYKNKGNRVESGNLSFAYDEINTDFQGATEQISSPSSEGVITWNYNNLKPFEIREILVTMHINSGSELIYDANISNSNTDEYNTDNHFQYKQQIQSSYEPYEYKCLEGIGVYATSAVDLHYMIRFKNQDDSQTTHNLVLEATLSNSNVSELINSFFPISSSHPYTLKYDTYADGHNGKLQIIFENINITPQEEGYFAFKIKSSSNVFFYGPTFYFDYKPPIINSVNSTTYVYNNLADSDFIFQDYFKIYPVPVKDVLNIEFKKSIQVSSIQIYNTLGQLVQTIPNAQQTKTVDVSGLKTGNYFMKINSDKGSSSAKFVKL